MVIGMTVLGVPELLWLWNEQDKSSTAAAKPSSSWSRLIPDDGGRRS